ncbi:MAG: tRNA epoxyqueuosine(34) reductase QueG [Planctomycetes bacterium]|jgi:epoxyqueuosine reductase|nr:tRNA epoxyqueuosine(34) reductase QueG [Planctomycetota bacterium]
MSWEQEIKDQALALGFDAVGITDASPLDPDHIAHFEAWLRSGYAGRMDYLHRNLASRFNPAQLLEGAKSILVVALSYKPPEAIANCGEGVLPATQKQDALDTNEQGRVAQYAQYEDYHPFIKARLRTLVDFLQAGTDGRQRFKICVDSAPLAEKALAARAGLGFLGRNHLLIHPRLGPQVLLGEIVTTVSLRPDPPSGGSCGACARCLQACPTGALRPDGFLDARRCVSYRTQYGAEEEGNGVAATQPSNIPLFHHWHPPGSWLFGCDECLLACPFQRHAPTCANPHFRRYAERAALQLREVLAWTTEEFEATLHDSPIQRLGLEMLQRNARRCLRLEV